MVAARGLQVGRSSSSTNKKAAGVFSGGVQFPSDPESISGLRAFDVAFGHPRHERAEFLARFLDTMFLAGFHKCVILLVAPLVFLHPLLSKFAALDVLERLLHPLLNGGVDDLRS